MTFPLLDRAPELISELIIPLLSARDVIALGRTCRELHSILLDKSNPESEFIWKRRIKQDLRFPVESTARQNGWLELYRRIRIPHVYLWGETRNGRLAIEPNDPRVRSITRGGFIPYPARLPIQVPIVDLVAGGWSFHALSVDGKVYHWGQLDGASFAPFRGNNHAIGQPSIPLTAYPGAMVASVTQFHPSIPPINRLLSGRLHILAQDDDGRLWTWANWAEAGLISPSSFDDDRDATSLLSSSWLDYSKHRIVDFAAGWSCSVALLEDRRTKHRNVYAWWQRFLSPTLYESQAAALTQDQPTNTRPLNNQPGCYSFSPQQVIQLPDLPSEDSSSDEYIDKLAAGDNFVIALSNLGKVYKLNLAKPTVQPGFGAGATTPAHLQGLVPDQIAADDEEPDDGRMQRRSFAELERLLAIGARQWEYLKHFSEGPLLEKDHHSYMATVEKSTKSSSTARAQSSKRKITFISANFRTFFCIGDGLVLQGNSESVGDSGPTVKTELQDRGVIRVECGDYHFGALTANGELLTFGSYSNGALGLGLDNNRLDAEARRGQTREVTIPQKVAFLDPQLLQQNSAKEDEFCFNISMAGWTSGALCVNLSQDVDDEDEAFASVTSVFKGKGRALGDEKAESEQSGTNQASSELSQDDVEGHAHSNRHGQDQEDESPDVDNSNDAAGTTFGTHRRPLPGVFGRGTIPFRIGFAGRGAMRGRAIRRGQPGAALQDDL